MVFIPARRRVTKPSVYVYFTGKAWQFLLSAVTSRFVVAREATHAALDAEPGSFKILLCSGRQYEGLRWKLVKKGTNYIIQVGKTPMLNTHLVPGTYPVSLDPGGEIVFDLAHHRPIKDRQ